MRIDIKWLDDLKKEVKNGKSINQKDIRLLIKRLETCWEMIEEAQEEYEKAGDGYISQHTDLTEDIEYLQKWEKFKKTFSNKISNHEYFLFGIYRGFERVLKNLSIIKQ